MDEYILAAILARDEAEPLALVEPFHFSSDRDGGRRIGRNSARSRPVAGRPLRALDNSGRIDFQNPGHLRTLGAGADLDAQFGALRNRVVARGMQGVRMQERVALAARQLNESVALVRLEPFDDRIDRRRAGIHRPRGRPAGEPPKPPPSGAPP